MKVTTNTEAPTETELAKMDPGVASWWSRGAEGDLPVFVRLGKALDAQESARVSALGLALTGIVMSGRLTKEGLLFLLRSEAVVEVADGSTILTYNRADTR